MAFLRSMLEAANYRVHCYTSPHLIRRTERIYIGGEDIEDDYLQELLDQVNSAHQGEPLTLFPSITAAAFLAFSQHPADILLLEVGMGGQFDPTNVIEEPLCTLFTRIALDHCETLGTTLSQIAHEKAGIIKPDTSVLTISQFDPVNQILEKVATEKQAFFQECSLILNLPSLGLIGNHQRENASLALHTVEHLNTYTVPRSAREKGLCQTQWPGRLQLLDSSQFPHLFGTNSEVWLDGAHNENAATAIASEIQLWPPHPLSLIVALRKNKDPEHFLKPFKRLCNQIYFVPMPAELKFHDVDTLQSKAQSMGFKAFSMPDIPSAFHHITAHSHNHRILICGSLLLAGHILGSALKQRPRYVTDRGLINNRDRTK